MPESVRTVLTCYWSELMDVSERVATLWGRVGILFTWTLDYDWAVTTLHKLDPYISAEAILAKTGRAAKIVADAISEFLNSKGFPFTVLYYVDRGLEDDSEVGFFMHLDDLQSLSTPILGDRYTGKSAFLSDMRNRVYCVAETLLSLPDTDSDKELRERARTLFFAESAIPSREWEEFSDTVEVFLQSPIAPLNAFVQEYVVAVKVNGGYAFRSGVINLNQWLSEQAKPLLDEVLDAFGYSDIEAFIKETWYTDGSDWVYNDDGTINKDASPSYVVDAPFLSSLIVEATVIAPITETVARGEYPSGVLSAEQTAALVKAITGKTVQLD